MRRRLFLATTMALVLALVLPSTALAYSWTKTPVSPLIKGGVHSKAAFIKLLTSSAKERNAIKAVIKADGYPSWVFDAAVAEAKAGKVYSSNLKRGTFIGAMAFGPNRTKIEKKTTWRGKSSLPYYYVTVSQSTTQGAVVVTESYLVCVAKACANPFVLKRTVTTRPLYGLWVEIRDGGPNGPQLADWTINGEVNGRSVQILTKSGGPTLVGYYPAGTTYGFEATVPNFWIVQPTGVVSGVLGAQDVTLEWIAIESPN